MLFKQLFNRTNVAAIAVCLSCGAISPAFSQGFYFPSASFFSPFAANYGYESAEDGDDLNLLIQQYPDFQSRWEQAQLTESLKGEKFLTVLVPSETAFAALSPKMQEKLSQPENLKKLMQYHVVVGKISEQDIQRRAVATLLAQNSVVITGVPQGDNKIGVKLNQANASQPLAATDGVLIPIDAVLIPPELAEQGE